MQMADDKVRDVLKVVQEELLPDAREKQRIVDSLLKDITASAELANRAMEQRLRLSRARRLEYAIQIAEALDAEIGKDEPSTPEIMRLLLVQSILEADVDPSNDKAFKVLTDVMKSMASAPVDMGGVGKWKL